MHERHRPAGALRVLHREVRPVPLRLVEVRLRQEREAGVPPRRVVDRQHVGRDGGAERDERGGNGRLQRAERLHERPGAPIPLDALRVLVAALGVGDVEVGADHADGIVGDGRADDGVVPLRAPHAHADAVRAHDGDPQLLRPVDRLHVVDVERDPGEVVGLQLLGELVRAGEVVGVVDEDAGAGEDARRRDVGPRRRRPCGRGKRRHDGGECPDSTQHRPGPNTRTSSASCEVRLPLFDEGAQPLARILGGAREIERLALQLDPGLERRLEGGVDRLLRQAHGDRPLRRDLAGDPFGLLEPRFRGGDARHEPVRERLARRQHAPGEDHVHGERLADGAREPLRAAGAGEHTEVDLGLAELRRLGRDDQVAEHRQLAAASETEAGHRRDDRRAHLADRVPSLESRALVERHRRSRRELVDVRPRREGAVPAGEDDRADLLVAVELRERLDDCVHQLARERVQLLGPVHAHDADPAVALDEDVRLRHVYDEFTSLEIDRPEKSILRITLRAPGTLNALDAGAHAQIAAVWQTIDRDPDTRVVLVRGAGGTFSSGGDLALVEEIARDWETRLRVFHEARDLVYNIVNCRKPVVAAIDGPAVGAGLAIALLADISVAAPSARIVDGHTRLGVAAGDHAVIVWPLLCGMAKAKYHLLLNEPVDGEEAERLGLVSLCVPTAELEERALEIARKLTHGSQAAIEHTKLALNNWLRAAGPAFDASLALEFLDMTGPDVAEGVAAVRGRRPPRFS
ncbi:MAG: enoyl-CoA hydratase/isomerase family protein [Actinobacteria bacterium]|nr:enoyl-CoA hydratase/isomerase family protein [Actinomycetota bacterium]